VNRFIYVVRARHSVWAYKLTAGDVHAVPPYVRAGRNAGALAIASTGRGDGVGTTRIAGVPGYASGTILV
jgi:hypothetical protein